MPGHIAKLGDIAKVISGYAFKSSEFKKGGSIPVIKIKNIRLGYTDLNESGYVDESYLDIDSKFHVLPGDILISLTGSHMTQPNSVVGRVAVYQDSLPMGLLNQRAGKIIPKNNQVNKKFLFYALMSELTRKEIAQMANGAASQANLSPSQVESVEIFLPENVQQQIIADILSAYDNLIENNNRRIAILEEMTQCLYREWFVKFHFPGHENTKFIDSPLGKIPEGWVVMSASEAIDINPRTKLPKEGEKPFVPMSGLSVSSMLIGDIQMKTGNSGAKFINGDTLFARITPCLENGKTAYVQFLDEENPVGFGSTEFIVFREKKINSEFIYTLALSDSFRYHAIKSMTGASGRQRVQNACFDSYMVPVPTKDHLDKYQVIIKPLYQEIYNLSSQNTNLNNQRNMVLPKLIAGKIRLKGT